jgi:hypothetical protein
MVSLISGQQELESKNESLWINRIKISVFFGGSIVTRKILMHQQVSQGQLSSLETYSGASAQFQAFPPIIQATTGP